MLHLQKGTQISANKFDYCVFVTFAYDTEAVKDILIFERKDLQEIQNRRKGVARYESTNPCLFMYAPSLKAFEDWVKRKKVMAFRIEREVHKNPKKFKNAWKKIK